MTRLRIGVALAVGLLASACGREPPASGSSEPQPARFVGGAACVGCHSREAESWRGSHHDQAMQIAHETTVLGDFDDAELTHGDITSTFFRRDGRFVVRTDGPDGTLADFEITHTFGIDPLQQYLIAFPGGRYQALSIAWDSRPADAGGQRWFHLYPNERIDAAHPLHWTRMPQNWNAGCAECHSTGLEKKYSAATDTYATTWIDIDVNCEACHGPGSQHVGAPEEAPMALGSASRAWVFQDATGIASRMPAKGDDDEIESCAQCHARRSQSSEDFVPGASAFLDAFRPALLEPDLYYADGQIRDEVYEYGSFLQSAMYAAGVTCSDCHDPHSAELRAPGNELCAQCHAPARFDTPDHHRHTDDAGSQCAACHMPTTTYMTVDPRHDHSFRVPRPDLTASLGVPNACNACHGDRAPGWAAAQVAGWYPEGRHTAPHYGETIGAGREWAIDRSARLRALIADESIPAIVRATGIELLGGQLDVASLDVVANAVESTEPLVQQEAIEALGAAPPALAVDKVQRFLSDPSRAKRLSAALALVSARLELSERRRADLERALDEYRTAATFDMDGAGGYFNWGTALAALGRDDEAARNFRAALERDPDFVPAYVNLADVTRRIAGETAAQALLENARARAPDAASVHYALGLSDVRSGDLDAAISLLARAVELEPEVPQYAYTLGVALRSTAEPERGVDLLRRTHERFPGHADTLFALATMLRDDGRRAEAIEYARTLVDVSARDPTALALLSELETSR